MKVLIEGADVNAFTCAAKLAESGQEVVLCTGKKGYISELLPGSVLAPEVATGLNLGLTLDIVGRKGRSSKGEEVSLTLREAGGDVTENDQKRWSDFVRLLNNGSDILRNLHDSPGSDLATRWRDFGRRQALEVLRLPWLSLSELLDEWFEGDLLKATLAVAALRGNRQGPFAPGSAFLLLQRWARGEVFGRGKLRADSVREAAQNRGASLKDEEVVSFQVSRGKVHGAELSNGETVEADFFVSSRDLSTVLKDKVGMGKLSPEVNHHLEVWDSRSTTTVVELGSGGDWGGALVSFCDTLEDLEKAYDPTKYGEFSQKPFGEFDSSAGFLYLQHLDGETGEERAGQFCQEAGLGEPLNIFTPRKLAQAYGVEGGHLYGGERSLWQSLALRQRRENPLPGLYFCGAGTGPGDYSGLAGWKMGARLIEALAPV